MVITYVNDQITETVDEDITGTIQHMRGLESVIHQGTKDDEFDDLTNDSEDE